MLGLTWLTSHASMGAGQRKGKCVHLTAQEHKTEGMVAKRDVLALRPTRVLIPSTGRTCFFTGRQA